MCTALGSRGVALQRKLVGPGRMHPKNGLRETVTCSGPPKILVQNKILVIIITISFYVCRFVRRLALR
jgi:hypothetical protein